MDDSGGGFSKPISTKLGRQKEVIKFNEWLSQFQLAERTIELYTKIVELFLKRREINQTTINLFLKKRPRPSYKIALRRYFEFKGWDYTLPEKLKIPEKKIRDVPDTETLKGVIGKLDGIRKKREYVFWVIILLFNTGARIHEVLNLRVGDIKFDDEKIIFRTKGKRFREVRIRKEIVEGLYDYFVKEKGLLKGEKLFFRHSKKDHTAYVTFRKFIYNSDLDEKEKRMILRTHNFRRAVIDLILEKTGNIVAVKEFVGHKDIETTMGYIEEKRRKKEAQIGNKVLLDELS